MTSTAICPISVCYRESLSLAFRTLIHCRTGIGEVSIDARQSVLFLLPASEPGGEGVASRALAVGLPAKEFRVTVGVLGCANAADLDELSTAEIAVKPVPIRHMMDVSGMRRLRQFVRECPPEILHTWGAVAARAARRLGVPAEQLTLIAPAAPHVRILPDSDSASSELRLPPGAQLIVADGRSEKGFGPSDAIFAIRPHSGVEDALQAMAAGKAVIGWGTADLAEIVEDKMTGLLVNLGDRAALAASMRAVLENPSYARRLGDAGRARAGERFGRARMIEQFVRLYRELLPPRCTDRPERL